jgi:type II restriction/modification system DNA methylase subunit YeeA
MRERIAPLNRFLVTTTVSKHRIFAWEQPPTLPDHQLVAFGRDDDFFFGLLHSRLHEVWALAQGTQLREKESGFRYTPTSCFETFPFPRPTPVQEGAMAAAANELNELRERWLNPPEWTETRTLEFPGSADGPWARYVHNPNREGIGTVRYPRLEPRDADCAAKLKKRTLTNLYNERPAWLDLAHKKLDAAVAAAYGWPADLSDEQILEKLLALNLERAAEEARAAKVKKPKAQRGKTEAEMI